MKFSRRRGAILRRMKRIAVLLLFALSAVARPAPPPPHHLLADYLALDTSQQEAWRTIQSELRATAAPLHEQLRDATDPATIESLERQLDAARKAAHRKFAALLTTEQQLKFEAFQAAVEYLRQHGPGGGGPR